MADNDFCLWRNDIGRQGGGRKFVQSVQFVVGNNPFNPLFHYLALIACRQILPEVRTSCQ